MFELYSQILQHIIQIIQAPCSHTIDPSRGPSNFLPYSSRRISRTHPMQNIAVYRHIGTAFTKTKTVSRCGNRCLIMAQFAFQVLIDLLRAAHATGLVNAYPHRRRPPFRLGLPLFFHRNIFTELKVSSCITVLYLLSPEKGRCS
jgi:hypothetical protein